MVVGADFILLAPQCLVVLLFDIAKIGLIFDVCKNADKNFRARFLTTVCARLGAMAAWHEDEKSFFENF